MFPRVLTKFPNSRCFPRQGFFFAIFPVTWVPGNHTFTYFELYEAHRKIYIFVKDLKVLVDDISYFFFSAVKIEVTEFSYSRGE